MLTAEPRGQFPRWRRNRKRLSVCSVLRCPDLWLQCSVSFVHGVEKTHAWETWSVAAADGVRCARVRWEINFLLTSETLPFFCVHPVYAGITLRWISGEGSEVVILSSFLQLLDVWKPDKLHRIMGSHENVITRDLFASINIKHCVTLR